MGNDWWTKGKKEKKKQQRRIRPRALNQREEKKSAHAGNIPRRKKWKRGRRRVVKMNFALLYLLGRRRGERKEMSREVQHRGGENLENSVKGDVEKKKGRGSGGPVSREGTPLSSRGVAVFFSPPPKPKGGDFIRI